MTLPKQKENRIVLQKRKRMKKNVWLGVVVILVLQAVCSYTNQQIETFAQFEQEPNSAEQVITLRGTLSQGSYTPITINQPGVYRLAGVLSVTSGLAAIQIIANNVFLDLDGNTVTVAGNAGGIFINGQDVKVVNGTIAGSGSTGCGVQVQGNNCRLEHIDVVSTATGFACINAGSNMLLDCRALQSSSAGFSFVSSGTNTVSRCQALNLAGSNSVYGFLVADGRANIFDSCIVSDAKTSALTSAAQIGGFVFKGTSSFNKLSNGKVTNISVSNSAVPSYGIFCDLVLSTSNSITNNRVNGVTNTATGVGIKIDSSANYVAQNISCNNDVNFENIAPSYITSQANARGVYNINCLSDVPDTVEVTNSTIDTTVVPELWSIESKAEVISSKIDTVPGALTPELWSIESKAEVISSKIDFIDHDIKFSMFSKLDRIDSTVESKLDVIIKEGWSIESKAEVISSKIDVPAPCSLTPIISSGTTHTNKQIISGPSSLMDSGDYCLSADLTGGDIVIAGNNISLDLNGYTVYNGTYGIDITGSKVEVMNGTIQSPTNTGVRLRSAKCTLSSLDVVNTKTGYLLSGAAYNQLNNCRALDCTRAGFSLETSGATQSTYNSLTGCQALNTGGSTTSISGFAATSGISNTFDSCSVSNVFNSKTSSLADAQGIRLASETNSQIIACSVDGVLSSTLSAYGIRLTTTQAVLADVAFSDANNATAVAWLQVSGTVRYLALAYTTNVRVLRYNGTSLTSVATQAVGATANSVAWTTLGGNNYLAVTTNTSAGDEVLVYQFTAPNTLTAAGSASRNQNTLSCAWSDLGSTKYLTVVGVNSGGRMQTYPYNGTVLGGTISYAGANTYTDVDAIQYLGVDYMAVVENTTNTLRIFSFNGTTFTLLNSIALANPIQNVKWLSKDSNVYLAVAGGAASANYVNVYSVILPVGTISASPVAFYNHGAQVNSVSWTSLSGNNYLAIGGAAGTGGATARVLAFDGTTLTPIFSYTSGITNGVDWFGQYLAIAQNVTSGVNARVLNLGQGCLNCLVDSNTVTNVHGGTLSGIGYAVTSVQNLLIANIAYNNDTNFYPTQNPANGNIGF